DQAAKDLQALRVRQRGEGSDGVLFIHSSTIQGSLNYSMALYIGPVASRTMRSPRAPAETKDPAHWRARRGAGNVVGSVQRTFRFSAAALPFLGLMTVSKVTFWPSF